MSMAQVHVHAACPCPYVCLCVCINAGLSGIWSVRCQMKKLTMLGLVQNQTKPMKSGIFSVLYQTEIMNAGMPMTLLVCSMPMPILIGFIRKNTWVFCLPRRGKVDNVEVISWSNNIFQHKKLKNRVADRFSNVWKMFRNLPVHMCIYIIYVCGEQWIYTAVGKLIF